MSLLVLKTAIEEELIPELGCITEKSFQAYLTHVLVGGSSQARLGVLRLCGTEQGLH